MKLLFVYLVMLAPFIVVAQNNNILLIPDSLKKNADVVKRYEEYVLEIKSPGKAIVRKRNVYTVLNEAGKGYGGYVSYYDKFRSINSITGVLYDMMGKDLKRIKKKDMQDLSYDDNMSLAIDTRLKVYDFYCKNYPYTVDFEEEADYDGIRDFTDWTPVSAPNMSVQYSKYVIIAPKNYLVRYKNFNYNLQPVITENGDKKTYTWEIKNIQAVKTESNSPNWREIVPYVMMAPSEFEAQGYRGNMTTWEGYGKFIYQLVQGRDVLPEAVKAKVHELTDNIKDEHQKVYILYDYLQKNTRYISIQFGIGGWQPFDATYVATKKYGDCKALSNFMVALLKEAGIKAKYVEIMAGDDAIPLIEDFSCSQANHAISCVPFKTDTVWLECTSQTKSPGYMGTFTGDRKALLIDEDGGHIVNTPVYRAIDNLQYRVVNAKIDEEGNLDADVNTRFTGTQQESPHELIYEISKEVREKYLNRAINLPTYQVDKSDYVEEKGNLPVVKEFLHITSPGYANITGKRLFVTPNLFNRTATRYSADSVRKYDIVFNDPYRDLDSIVLNVPKGYAPESLPQDVSVESKFGKYKTSLKVEGDKIVYYRMHEKPAGHFPAKDYNDLVKFQEQIYKADRAKIVMVKKRIRIAITGNPSDK